MKKKKRKRKGFIKVSEGVRNEHRMNGMNRMNGEGNGLVTASNENAFVFFSFYLLLSHLVLMILNRCA